MSGMGEERSSQNGKTKMVENNRIHCSKDAMSGSQLWIDGLICAFEFIRPAKRSVVPKSAPSIKPSRRLDEFSVKDQMHYDGGTESKPQISLLESEPLLELEAQKGGSSNVDGQKSRPGGVHPIERCEGSCWVPIGWARISELIRTVQADEEWANQHFEFVDGEDDITVADLAAPYWERPVGPTWWCHLSAGHPNVEAWLNAAQWLHPAIRTALRDESRLISERMKHLLYEVYGSYTLQAK